MKEYKIKSPKKLKTYALKAEFFTRVRDEWPAIKRKALRALKGNSRKLAHASHSNGDFANPKDFHIHVESGSRVYDSFQKQIGEIVNRLQKASGDYTHFLNPASAEFSEYDEKLVDALNMLRDAREGVRDFRKTVDGEWDRVKRKYMSNSSVRKSVQAAVDFIPDKVTIDRGDFTVARRIFKNSIRELKVLMKELDGPDAESYMCFLKKATKPYNTATYRHSSEACRESLDIALNLIGEVIVDIQKYCDDINREWDKI